MSEAISTDVTVPGRAGKYHYEAGVPIRDFAAAAIAGARAKYEKQYPDADMSGLIWLATKVDDTEVPNAR
jgi:hypothetical protein